MNMKLGALENEIKQIKSKEDSKTSEFSCEKCDYQASSNTVLKRHISTKHKHKTLTPEKERSSISEKSVKAVSPSPTTEIFEAIPDSKPSEPAKDSFSSAQSHSL